MIRLPVIPPWLQLAFRIAPWLIAAGLLAALLVTRARADARETRDTARYERDIASIRTATAAAHALDQANARRVEAAQTAITQGASRDLEAQLARARADAAAYSRRLRDRAAAQGGGGTAGVPGPAQPAGPVAGAGGAAQLDDDLRICAEAVTKAQGWQDWWRAIEAVPR